MRFGANLKTAVRTQTARIGRTNPFILLSNPRGAEVPESENASENDRFWRAAMVAWGCCAVLGILVLAGWLLGIELDSRALQALSIGAGVATGIIFRTLWSERRRNKP